MDKKYCFAYDSLKNKCKALTDLYCEKEGKCNFYKTSRQLQQEQEKNKKNEVNNVL